MKFVMKQRIPIDMLRLFNSILPKNYGFLFIFIGVVTVAAIIIIIVTIENYSILTYLLLSIPILKR